MFVNLRWLCYISAGGITKQNNQRVKMAGKQVWKATSDCHLPEWIIQNVQDNKAL